MASPQKSPKSGAMSGIHISDLWKTRGDESGCRWLVRVRLRGHSLSRAFPDDCADQADRWALARRAECYVMTPAEAGAKVTAEREANNLKDKATLGTLLAEFLSPANGGRQRRTTATYRDRLHMLVKRAEDAGVANLNAPNAADRIAAFLEGMDILDSTRGTYSTCFKTLSRLAHRKGYTKKDVLSELRYSTKANRSPQPLTIAEARSLMSDAARIDEEGTADPMWLLLAVLLYSGLRLEAARFLKWEDVTWRGTPESPSGVLAITEPTHVERLMGKGIKMKTNCGPGEIAWLAALQPELREILVAEARNRFGDLYESTGNGYVFSDAMRSLQPARRREMYENAGKRVTIDLSKRVLHDLRHTHIGFMVGTGIAVDVVRRRVGHSEKSQITAHYTSGSDSAELRHWTPGELNLRKPAPLVGVGAKTG